MILGALALPLTAEGADTNKVKKVNTFRNPDFAYPRTVDENAEKALESAAASGDWESVCAAATQRLLARADISRSSIGSSIAGIDSLAAKAPAPWRAMLLTLEAVAYKNVYESDRWTFDRRELPTDTFPHDIMEWSGDMFALRLMELAAKTGISGLYSFDIQLVQNLIDPLPAEQKKSKSLPYQPWFPTVGDFVSHTFCGLLSDFADKTERIPFGVAESGKQTVGERVTDFLTLVYEERLKMSGDDPKAMAQAVLDRADVLSEADALELVEGAYRAASDCDARIRLFLWISSHRRGDYEEDFENVWIDGDCERLAGACPDSEFIPQLKNLAGEMSAQRLALHMRRQNLSSSPLEVVVRNVNSHKVTLLLVSVPETCQRMSQLLASGKVVASRTLEAAGSVPFSVSDTISFPPQSPGRYCIMPSANGRLDGIYGADKGNRYIDTFTVSDIMILVSELRYGGISRIFVVSGANMRPCPGARVTAVKNEYGKQKRTLSLTTEKDGGVAIPSGSWELTASFGGSNAGRSVYIPAEDDNKERETARLDIFTDLGLYKPGQTVNFVAVATSVSGREQKVAYPDSVTFTLIDANWQEVDKQTVRPAADGRSVGHFEIPEGRLNGNWAIRATAPMPGSEKTASGSASIRVEEYKLPSFYAEIDSIPVSKVGEPLIISGFAKTYSGMPVSDAKVKLDIRTLRFWWRFSGSPDGFFSISADTDTDGRFTIKLATDRIAGTRYEEALLSASAEVTDNAGETETAPSVYFSFRTLASLSVSAPDVASTDDTTPLKAVGTTVGGDRVALKVAYKIENIYRPGVVAEGKFITPDCPVSPAMLAAGRYRLTFSDAESESGQPLFEPQTVEMTVYDKKSVHVPYPTELWVAPVVTDSDAGVATISFGSGYADSWILVQTSDCEKLVSRDWVRVDSTLSQLRLRLPEPGNRLYVQLMGARNLSIRSRELTISNPKDLERGRFETVSFRDRIVPGAKERWSFRYLVGDRPGSANVIATMTDKALNAVQPFTWGVPGAYINWYSRASLAPFPVGTTSSSFDLTKFKALPAKGISLPTWYMYGQYFGRMMRRMYARGAVYANAAIADGAVEDLEEIIPTSMTITRTEMKLADEAVRFRPGEMPLAFFRPMLPAGKDGEVELAFDVPDFNTTWALQLVGYDADVHTARLALDAVAAKAVMVRPNLPRFLRAGDVTQLRATLFNNSGAEAPVGGRIEILDALTDKAIASESFDAEPLGDAASRVVSLDFTAPSDCEYLAVRCYATIDGDVRHTDAEQSLVVVLPAAEPVVESTPFWMSPGQQDLKVTLPEFGKDDSVWLTYCDNPVWLCLTALPDITTAPGKDLFSKTAALYGRSIAAGIVRDIPRAKEAIGRWFATGGDELVSPLMKDSELKTLALQRTPWVNNAETETLRMLQLDRLLDGKENEKEIDSLLGQILKLQSKDGGLSWCPDFETSLFATSMPLLYVGMLRQFGYEPDSDALGKAMRSAIAYCDKEIHRTYVGKKVTVSAGTLLNWLYIRSFYTDVSVPSDVSGLYSKALGKMSSEWRDFGIYDAATAAITLYRNGRVDDAIAILSSLKERASHSPERGYWFDNLGSEWGAFNKLVTTAQALEAYTEVSAGSASTAYEEMIDGLRQWLLLQRQAEDWGSDRMLAEVVNVVLRSGMDWTQPQDASEILLGRRKLDINADSFTGSMTVPLNPGEASGATLSVRKKGAHPAWGAVVSRRYMMPSMVKAASTPEIKIEKRLLRINTEDGVETVSEVGEEGLKVGDRVRVLLTVTADRDAEYVAITDSRAAFLEPVEQVSGIAFAEGLRFYRETRDSSTRFFMQFMPKGVHQLTYDCFADRAGDYSLGIATLQSSYAPGITAHSAGAELSVR